MSVIMYLINRFQISQLNLLGIGFLFLAGTLVLFYGNIRNKITCCLVFYIIVLGMEFIIGVLFSVAGKSRFVNPDIDLYVIINTYNRAEKATYGCGFPQCVFAFPTKLISVTIKQASHQRLNDVKGNLHHICKRCLSLLG